MYIPPPLISLSRTHVPEVEDLRESDKAKSFIRVCEAGAGMRPLFYGGLRAPDDDTDSFLLAVFVPIPGAPRVREGDRK